MKIKSVYRLTFICCIVFLLPLQDFGQKKNENSDLRHWPAGSTPQEIGKRLAEHFVIRPLPVAPGKVLYPEVCTWYGALTFASLTKDTKLIASLEERFKPLLGADSVLIPIPDHVDNTVFGSVPLELYLITKDLKYLTLGKRIADRQWASPDSTQVTHNAKVFYEKGFTSQTRMWIDDMFMITAVQVQAYRATGDKKYIERAAKEMVLYLDSLQRPNGLFFHAPDVPFFWSRGNGWMAAGMSELLSSLPKNNAERPRIMEGYKKMMVSLVKYQDENGTWRQLIDQSDSWNETSGTGMFAFAMITGVKNGWLDKNIYGAAARKAWLGLISYIDKNDDLHEVCEGTNKKNDRQYYFDRKRNVGDLHGQAPVLWCVSALLR